MRYFLCRLIWSQGCRSPGAGDHPLLPAENIQIHHTQPDVSVDTRIHCNWESAANQQGAITARLVASSNSFLTVGAETACEECKLGAAGTLLLWRGGQDTDECPCWGEVKKCQPCTSEQSGWRMTALKGQTPPDWPHLWEKSCFSLNWPPQLFLTFIFVYPKRVFTCTPISRASLPPTNTHNHYTVHGTYRNAHPKTTCHCTNTQRWCTRHWLS